MYWSRWSSSVAVVLSFDVPDCQLLIYFRDLLQGVVGLLHVAGDALVGLAAQRLNALRRAVELLRQRLSRADRLALRRGRTRADVDRACTALVKLLNIESSVVLEPG